MQCRLPTQGMRSIISIVSISPEGFLPSILLLVVIIVTVVIVVVMVFLIVVVVVVMIIRVVGVVCYSNGVLKLRLLKRNISFNTLSSRGNSLLVKSLSSVQGYLGRLCSIPIVLAMVAACASIAEQQHYQHLVFIWQPES
ncbi:hypothetical protein Tco_1338154 [Tanacetum coccineum]